MSAAQQPAADDLGAWHLTVLPPPPERHFHPDPATDMQLKYLSDRVTAIEACLSQGTERMGAMQTELTANTATTTEVRDILGAARGFFKFCSSAGTVIKWVGGLAGAATAIYVALYTVLHGGQPPGGK